LIFPRRQKGATLLETMLALAIGGFILVLSLKFYQSFNLKSQLALVQFNVDQLFAAMSGYYRANCGTAAFSPAAASPQVVPIVGTLDAYVPGFKWQPVNPIVFGSGVGSTGYVTQFSMTTNTPVTVNDCVVLTPGTPCLPESKSLPSTQAQSVVWTMQVSVKLANANNATGYYASMGADCTSALVTGKTYVHPCIDGVSGPYLVWMRLPSMASPTASSILWPTMPLVKQFNLQYTHDQMYELMPGTVDELTGQTMRNYLCGG